MAIITLSPRSRQDGGWRAPKHAPIPRPSESLVVRRTWIGPSCSSLGRTMVRKSDPASCRFRARDRPTRPQASRAPRRSALRPGRRSGRILRQGVESPPEVRPLEGTPVSGDHALGPEGRQGLDRMAGCGPVDGEVHRRPVDLRCLRRDRVGRFLGGGHDGVPATRVRSSSRQSETCPARDRACGSSASPASPGRCRHPAGHAGARRRSPAGSDRGGRSGPSPRRRRSDRGPDRRRSRRGRAARGHARRRARPRRPRDPPAPPHGRNVRG